MCAPRQIVAVSGYGTRPIVRTTILAGNGVYSFGDYIDCCKQTG